MQPKLPASLYSADQVLTVAEELHQHGLSLGRAQGTKREAEPLSPAAAELVAGLPKADREQGEAIEGLREALERLATTAAAVTLVVAAAPSAQLKEELVTWLRTNVRPHLLVNFHVNPDIAGGVVIRGTNRVFDCSFRTQLQRDPANFTKVLARV